MTPLDPDALPAAGRSRAEDPEPGEGLGLSGVEVEDSSTDVPLGAVAPLEPGALSQGLRRILFGSAVFFGSTVLINASKVLLIPVYTRYLSPAQYGVLGIANALAGLLSTVLLLGLHGAVVREYYDYRDDPASLRSYLSTVFIFLGILDVTVVAGLFVIGPGLATRFFPGSPVGFYPYLALALLIAVGTTFLGVSMALLQAQQRVVAYASFQLSRFGLLVGVTLVLLIWFHQGAEAPLWADLFAIFATLVGVGWLLLRGDLWSLPKAAPRPDDISAETASGPVVGGGAQRGAGLFSPSKLKAALAYGIPLVPHQLSNWTLSVSDRLILAKYRPVEEVGTYVLGYSLAMGLSIVVGALNFAYVPFFLDLAKTHPRAKEVFALVARAYVGVVGGVCLLGMLFARELLAIIAPPTYARGAGILVVVLLAFFFLGLYLIVVLPFYHAKRTRYLPMFSGLAAAVNLGLNLILVPKYGATAAAYTTLAAYVVLFLTVAIVASRFYPIDYRPDRFWGFICLVTATGLTLNAQPWEIRAVALGIFILLAAFSGRRDWVELRMLRAVS